MKSYLIFSLSAWIMKPKFSRIYRLLFGRANTLNQNLKPSHFRDHIEANEIKITTLSKIKCRDYKYVFYGTNAWHFSGVYSNHELNTHTDAMPSKKELLKVWGWQAPKGWSKPAQRRFNILGKPSQTDEVELSKAMPAEVALRLLREKISTILFLSLRKR